MQTNAAHFEQQIAPGEVRHDFLAGEKLRRVGTEPRAQTFAETRFSADSQNVHDYEAELKQISQIGLHKTIDQKDSLLRQFEFVFDALQRNRIPLTPQIRARMFEYFAVRNDID